VPAAGAKTGGYSAVDVDIERIRAEGFELLRA